MVGANPLIWRTSSRCDSSTCVEVARTATEQVLVRRSDQPDGAYLSFPPEVWREFLESVRAGSFDVGRLLAGAER